MSFCESSLEFDLFEEMRRNLATALAADGRDPVEAERIALYVMQGLREVPRLLNAVAHANVPSSETRELLNIVLDNASSLDKARAILLGLDDEQVKH